jgi:hypothetical protein
VGICVDLLPDLHEFGDISLELTEVEGARLQVRFDLRVEKVFLINEILDS